MEPGESAAGGSAGGSTGRGRTGGASGGMDAGPMGGGPAQLPGPGGSAGGGGDAGKIAGGGTGGRAPTGGGTGAGHPPPPAVPVLPPCQILGGNDDFLPVPSLRFSPDGRALAVVEGAGDRTRIIEYDPSTGVARRAIWSYPGLRAVEYSNDGRVMAVAAYSAPALVDLSFDLPRGSSQPVNLDFGWDVRAVAFSYDDQRVAFAGANETRIWNTNTRVIERTLPTPDARAVAFYGDGDRLAIAAPLLTQVIRISDGWFEIGMPTPPGETIRVMTTKYHLLVAGDAVVKYRLTDGGAEGGLMTGTGDKAITGFGDRLVSLAPIPGATFAALFRVTDGAYLFTLAVPNGSWVAGTAFAYSPDGARVAGALDDGRIAVWCM